MALVSVSAKGCDEFMIAKVAQYAQRVGLKGYTWRIKALVVGFEILVDDASVTVQRFKTRYSF